MSREDYLDERGKFREKNPGGGRPPNPKLDDFKPIVEELYDGWISECCELADVKNIEDLSAMVRTLLLNIKKVQLEIEMLSAKHSRSRDEQKLLNTLTGRVNNMLKDAHSILKVQIMIRKEKRKGGKKPTGMY